MPNADHVAIVKQGAGAIRQWRKEYPGEVLDLTDADLRQVDLRHADLRHADLRDARLDETQLGGTHLHKALIAGATMSTMRGAYRAYGLETTRFIPQSPTNATEALYFETYKRPWPERWLDWEHLRRWGQLPLFIPSYAALILLLTFFYGLELYNDQVAWVRTRAEHVMTQPDHLFFQLASLVHAHFHPRPIPRHSLVLFVSTILLAAGATLYAFFCPSRIKEFSRDQWCDQLGRSLVHYWPLAWKYRYIRLVCAVCYVLGGLGAGWVLVTKLWRVLLFILTYSPYPWPWR